MQLLGEKKLIKECQKGNLENFGELYDFYAEKIYRFIYFRLHHKETSQDLTSQTFFKALEKISTYEAAKGQFSSWLYRIAQNTLIDYFRVQKNDYNIDDIWDLKSNYDLDYDTQIKEKIQNVKEYLKDLSEEQRQIIIMRVWDGLSHKEISQIIGKSENNCKMIFSRAMAKLRKEEILVIVALYAIIRQMI